MAPKRSSLSRSPSVIEKSPKPAAQTESQHSSTKLAQNSKEFIGENLEGALVDWLKEQRMYKDASAQDKGGQEKVMKQLADNLITVIEKTPASSNNDTDAVLLEEIRSHVQKLPMDAKTKSNKNFVDELPTDILSHLKGLKLFQDLSGREDETSINMNITKWFEEMPLSMMSSGEKLNLRSLKDEFVDKIKQSDLEYESVLRDETKKFLENVSLDVDDDKEKQKLLYDLEETLIETIAKKPRKLRLQELSNKFVVEAVEQWARTLVLPESEDDSLKDTLATAKTDMVTTLSNKYVYTEAGSLKEFDETFSDATKEFLEKIPQHQYKEDNDVDILVKSLQDTFKEYSKKYPMLPDGRPAKKKAAVILAENVSKWVKKLPIEANTPEEELESEKLKLQLESKLINKIGEMNMNIEVFNDDFLYENILEEEIENLLDNIQSATIEDNKEQLKRSLMDIVLKARQSIQDENVNQLYKQQLHETIIKMMPTSDWSEEGRASLEVLKDEVADAFINMRYLGDNVCEMQKFKRQINDEIDQFCHNYLKRCPATPLDTKLICQKLYNALNKIPEPENESFRSEVEIIKLKYEINKWAKELPMKEQDAHDKLQKNKMISTLAKKLFDIEISKELTSAQEYGEKTRKEIRKFLTKQPLKTGNDEEINQLVEVLAKKLNDTEESRKMNASMKSFFACQSRKPQIRISFHDASISPRPTKQGEFMDCSDEVCLEPASCPVDKYSSVQTTRAGVRAIGSQMSFHSTDSWETVEGTCRQRPRTTSPRSASTGARQPTVRKCPQTPECLIPRQDSQCTKAALKSCLITNPFNPQPCNKPATKQHDLVREPCMPEEFDEDDDYEYQSPFQPCGPQTYEPQTSQSKLQCGSTKYSTSTPYPSPKLNSGCQRRPSCSQQDTGSSPNHPFHLSTQPKPGTLRDQADNTCRPQVDSIQTETQYHPPGQPCPIMQHLPGQRNVLESQYVPCSRSGIMQMVSEPPASCIMYPPPRQTQGQPRMSPRSSVTYSPSQQVPCPIRAPRPFTPDDYGSRPSPGYPPGFQRPMTRPGSADHMDPRAGMARQRWGKPRAEERPWESERDYFNSDEECNQREGKKCKCQHRLG